MRGLMRLIDGLIKGDPEAVFVLVFALSGTAVIYAVTQFIRARHRKGS